MIDHILYHIPYIPSVNIWMMFPAIHLLETSLVRSQGRLTQNVRLFGGMLKHCEN